MEVALTGAFSYTGRYITKKLLAEGIKIRALTNHPKVELFPPTLNTRFSFAIQRGKPHDRCPKRC